MKKILESTSVGFTITNILWSSIGLFVLIKMMESESSWLIILFLLLFNLVLSFSIGQLIERFETLYLKGKFLASGKYTIDK